MDQAELYQTKNCGCANLRSVTRLVTNMFDQILEPAGLKITQFTVLAALSNLGVCSINQLAEALLLDPTTLNRNLKPLEKQGLIENHPGEDQRTRLVGLSPKGEARLKEALPLWEQAQARLVESLGAPKFQAFLSDLQLVAGLLR
jgi:DNA-binding MarR family transcriptional regulator